MEKRLFGVADQCFRALLFAYPAEFRSHFGEEMRQVFRDRCRDTLGTSGFFGFLGFTLCATGDVLLGAARERAAVVRLGSMTSLFLAIAVGVFAAILDFHTDEVSIAVLVLLAGNFVVGFARPAGAWRWAIVAGGCIFVAYQFGPWLGFHPHYPAQPGNYATLLALAPAFVGAYSGSLAGRFMRMILLGCFVMFVACPVAGADNRIDQIDVYVKKQMETHHIPGLSIGVAKDGRTLLAKGYGAANVELSVPATADTVYEILSVGKQFTAAAVMLLRQEGRISLDEKISKYLDDLPPAWADITILQCLSHTSGIPDYADARGFFEHLRDDATPKALLDTVRDRPLRFEPGSKWRYSNSNYYLLGLLIEKVSGNSYEQFLDERVFRPLDMRATRINIPTDVIPNRAAGYHWLGEDAPGIPSYMNGYHGRLNVLQNAVYISPTRKWAAGAMLSTVNDLLKWDAALSSGKLLKRDSIAAMLTKATLKDRTLPNYGLGTELSEVKGHRVAGHQGGGMAFNCTLYRLVDDGLTVVVLCNQTSAPSRTIAAHIAATFLPELSDVGNPGIKDTEPDVTAMIQTVLEDAAVGTVDATQFSSEETARFIRRVGPRFLGPRGKMNRITLLERKIDGSRNYRYRTEFEKSALIWTLVLDDDGKIVSLEPTEE